MVMPAHNEENTIADVIKKASRYGNIVVIDDASVDSTVLEAKKAGARVIIHKENMGLGSALRTGFDYALKNKYDVVLTIDSDGQHVPSDIPKFLGKINEGHDFVLGERNLSKYPLIKKIGNFFLEFATNFVSGTKLKDTESGFRAIKIEALRKLILKAERYEIAVEIIYEVGRNKIRAANVPISSPVYVKGVSVKDGINNFRYLIKRRKRNLRMYFEDVRTVLRKNI